MDSVGIKKSVTLYLYVLFPPVSQKVFLQNALMSFFVLLIR